MSEAELQERMENKLSRAREIRERLGQEKKGKLQQHHTKLSSWLAQARGFCVQPQTRVWGGSGSGAFFVELVLKMVWFGPGLYLESGWNRSLHRSIPQPTCCEPPR